MAGTKNTNKRQGKVLCKLQWTVVGPGEKEKAETPCDAKTNPSKQSLLEEKRV